MTSSHAVGSKLVQRHLHGEQLIDNIRHPSTMMNTWDTLALSSSIDLEPDYTGCAGGLSKLDPAWERIRELHARRFATHG